MSDEELMERIKAGDKAAFETLYERYRGRVYSFFRRRFRHHEDCFDLCQEIFMAVWKKAGTYSPPPGAKLVNWLIVIGVRLMSSESRRNKGRRRQPLENLELESRELDPVEQSLLREVLERLPEVLDRLPPEYKQVIVLRYLEECSVEEIARKLGITESPVYDRLEKARKALKELLEGGEKDE
jgi:RNA polymerase sigma-70 factor (ECF subfamily)